MCLSVFFSETAAELAEEIGQLALFLGAMANINWPGLLAWSILEKNPGEKWPVLM